MGLTLRNTKGDLLTWEELDGNFVELDTKIDTEATARTTANAALQTSIDTEVTARTAADNTLTTNLAAEVTARTAADTALGNRLTVLENSSSSYTPPTDQGADKFLSGDGTYKTIASDTPSFSDELKPFIAAANVSIETITVPSSISLDSTITSVFYINNEFMITNAGLADTNGNLISGVPNFTTLYSTTAAALTQIKVLNYDYSKYIISLPGKTKRIFLDMSNPSNYIEFYTPSTYSDIAIIESEGMAYLAISMPDTNTINIFDLSWGFDAATFDINSPAFTYTSNVSTASNDGYGTKLHVGFGGTLYIGIPFLGTYNYGAIEVVRFSMGNMEYVKTISPSTNVSNAYFGYDITTNKGGTKLFTFEGTYIKSYDVLTGNVLNSYKLFSNYGHVCKLIQFSNIIMMKFQDYNNSPNTILIDMNLEKDIVIDSHDANPIVNIIDPDHIYWYESSKLLTAAFKINTPLVGPMAKRIVSAADGSEYEEYVDITDPVNPTIKVRAYTPISNYNPDLSNSINGYLTGGESWSDPVVLPSNVTTNGIERINAVSDLATDTEYYVEVNVSNNAGMGNITNSDSFLCGFKSTITNIVSNTDNSYVDVEMKIPQEVVDFIDGIKNLATNNIAKSAMSGGPLLDNNVSFKFATSYYNNSSIMTGFTDSPL